MEEWEVTDFKARQAIRGSAHRKGFGVKLVIRKKRVDGEQMKKTMIFLVGLALMAGASGCAAGSQDSCQSDLTCPVEPACPNDPEAEAGDNCGIWVSASLGQDNNPGTK